MFGGTEDVGVRWMDDTWLWSLHTGEWTEWTGASRPSPRKEYGMTQLHDGTVVIIGGMTGHSTRTDEVWLFSFPTGWQQWANPTAHRVQPVARSMQVVVNFGDGECVMFGQSRRQWRLLVCLSMPP